LSDIRAGKAEDRIDALETESHDKVFVPLRRGHRGHEDRIGDLETGGQDADVRTGRSEDRIATSEDRIATLERGVSLREIWRDLVPAVAIGLAFWALTISQGQVSAIKVNQKEAQAGRAIAISVTCAALSAVIDQGRATISASDTRKARRAADTYRDGIAQRVQRQTGVGNLIREDGTLDCDRLQALSNVRKPR
jgi:hypothetical protein